MKIVKLILYFLFGLLFLNAGLNKFFDYLPLPAMTPVQIKFFTAFTSISWMLPLVAIIEVVGSILFIITKTRALGAIVILPVMVGILVHHLTVDKTRIVITLVLLAINILAIVDNWKKYKHLIQD